MLDISDVNTQGVEPKKEFTELPIGQYLVRIEGIERKLTKDQMNHRLVFTYKVYGGPNDGESEEDGLNLWHSNEEAVKIAKIDLVSIQTATNTFSKDAHDFLGKWMVYTKKHGVKEATKDKVYKSYAAVPAGMLESFKDVPPVPRPAPQTPMHPTPAPTQAPAAPAQAAAPAVSGQLPSWAAKK